MNLEKRKPSGREKDEESIQLLVELREKLHSEDPSIRRKAAYNLSWMQEDGLEILEETLFGPYSRRAKTAAAYGLRNMQGRMKKMALEIFEKGIKTGDKEASYVCKRALAMLSGKMPRAPRPRARRSSRIEIRDIPANGNSIRNANGRQSLGNRCGLSGNSRYRADPPNRGPQRSGNR